MSEEGQRKIHNEDGTVNKTEYALTVLDLFKNIGLIVKTIAGLVLLYYFIDFLRLI